MKKQKVNYFKTASSINNVLVIEEENISGTAIYKTKEVSLKFFMSCTTTPGFNLQHKKLGDIRGLERVLEEVIDIQNIQIIDSIVKQDFNNTAAFRAYKEFYETSKDMFEYISLCGFCWEYFLSDTIPQTTANITVCNHCVEKHLT